MINNAMPIVELKNVWVYFDQKLILEDISLQIEKGHFVGIIGPNGAGKTTLLRVITQQIAPTKGSLRLFGQDAFTARHLIGYVPQVKRVDWSFPVSVLDVVLMGRYGQLGLFRRPQKIDRDRAWRSLERVQMDAQAHQQISQLSGGQQQRVFIARALCSDPQLLILDEPTSGIDHNSRDNFYRLIRSLKEGLDLTIILVSHEIEVIPKIVNEIICLNRTVHIHDKPESVLESDHFQKMYGSESEIVIHGKVPHRMIEPHEQ